jgi:hypothetical protein
VFGPVLGIAAAGGIGLHLLGFLLLRVEAPVPPARRPEPAFVRYPVAADGDQALLREQALLFDSAPLFLPTRWNSAAAVNDIASLREETELFGAFAPSLRPGGPPMPANGAQGAAGSIDPRGLLEPISLRPLRAFGRGPSPLDGAPAGARVWLAEAVDLAARRTELIALPETLAAPAPDRLWNPAQFFLQMVAGVPAGPPVTQVGTGYGAWDEALRAAIGEPRFYAALADGYWHITIAP